VALIGIYKVSLWDQGDCVARAPLRPEPGALLALCFRLCICKLVVAMFIARAACPLLHCIQTTGPRLGHRTHAATRSTPQSPNLRPASDICWCDPSRITDEKNNRKRLCENVQKSAILY